MAISVNTVRLIVMFMAFVSHAVSNSFSSSFRTLIKYTSASVRGFSPGAGSVIVSEFSLSVPLAVGVACTRFDDSGRSWTTISGSIGLDDLDSLADVELLLVPFPPFFAGMFRRSISARPAGDVVISCFFSF